MFSGGLLQSLFTVSKSSIKLISLHADWVWNRQIYRNIDLTWLLFRSHKSTNKNLNVQKAITLFITQRNAHRTLYFRSCANLIDMWMRKLILCWMVVNYTVFCLIKTGPRITPHSSTHQIEIKLKFTLKYTNNETIKATSNSGMYKTII